MGARLGRVLLVIALLVAQQSALAHQIWHAAASSGPALAVAAPEHPPAPSPADRLCDLHSALGTVLGALSSAAALPLPPAPLEAQFVAPALPAFSVAAPAPASRDPPPFRL
jgi:hypothetical protein